jgi:hypothetical protein
MKIAAKPTGASHSKPAGNGAFTKAQTRALGAEINKELANSDVGIDQAEVAGTEIRQQTAPRGTQPEAAALYKKWAATADPHNVETAGASLYEFDSAGGKAWGVMKWDDKSTIMVLFDAKGEMGRGKLNDDNVSYSWSVRNR